jgi:histidinol-phosphatase
MPGTGEMFYAETGKGAFFFFFKISVSNKPLNDYYTTYGGLHYFKKSKLVEPLLELGDKTSHNGFRGYGDSWSFNMLAQGKIDIIVEAHVSIWDIAPSITIIEEAGGKVTDLEGNYPTVDTTTVVATNGIVHDEVLKIFNK